MSNNSDKKPVILYQKWEILKSTLQNQETKNQNYYQFLHDVISEFCIEFDTLKDNIDKLSQSLAINMGVFQDLVEEVYANIKTYQKKSIFIKIEDMSFIQSFGKKFEELITQLCKFHSKGTIFT